MRDEVAKERLLRGLAALRGLYPLPRAEYVVLPREEGARFEALEQPGRRDDSHVLEFADFGGGE